MKGFVPSDAEVPLDVAMMRTAVRRLMTGAPELLPLEELKDLVLQMRGYAVVSIPEVEAAAYRQSEDDIPRACALACVGEARRLLRQGASDETQPAYVAHVRRLARSVNALCDHRENLRPG
ncbi:DUF6415 family natural product biosynthesis protein [Streptomyces broussonetiae]|uniref:DUF6415 family natural product biosynthesis protein n=1 Tax=Streptomyces broussonetiae TaxID=2686304 RepID=A0ABV5EK33_9ACTN